MQQVKEHLVDVPKTVSRDRIEQRADEQIVDMAIPRGVEELVEVLELIVEQIVDVPDSSFDVVDCE